MEKLKSPKKKSWDRKQNKSQIISNNHNECHCFSCPGTLATCGCCNYFIPKLKCSFRGWGICQNCHSCRKFWPGHISIFRLLRFRETQNSWHRVLNCFFFFPLSIKARGRKFWFRGMCWGCSAAIPEDTGALHSKVLHSKISFTTVPHVVPPPEPLRLHPKIMKLTLLKLNLPSVNYPPESWDRFRTELNSFHLLFPVLFPL